MNRTSLKKNKSKYKLAIALSSLGLATACVAEIRKSDFKVLLFTAAEELRTLNPHRTFYNQPHDHQSLPYLRLFNEAISLLKSPFNSIAELTDPRYAKVRHVKLQIPYTTRQIINEDRSKAVQEGTLTDARQGRAFLIDTDGKKYKARVRLKGDLGQHWFSNKRYSLRVYLKAQGQTPAFPYKEFSLHKLSARQYPHEYLFSETLARLNLPNTNHEVVRVTVNNQDWGFMDLQEHYGDALLERQGLKPAPIITFGDERKWKKSLLGQQKTKNSENWLSHPRLNVRLSGNSSSDRSLHQNRLLDYIKEEVMTPGFQDRLFDPYKLNTVNMLLGIWGNYHAMSLINAKFYLNPFTLKLEPLLQDQGVFKKLMFEPSRHVEIVTNGFLKVNHSMSVESQTNLLRSVYRTFMEALKKYSTPFFRDDPPIDFALASANYNKTLAGLSLRKFSDQSSLDDNFYLSRIECSSNKSFDKKQSASPSLFARYTKDRLELLNLDCGPVAVTRVEACGRVYPLQISLKGAVDIYKPHQVSLDLDLSCKEGPDIFLKNPQGNDIKQEVDVIYNHRQHNPLLKQLAPSWITTNSKNEFLIKKGIYQVQSPIVLRKSLIIEPGTTLLFSNNAYLIVRGNVTIGAPDGASVILKGVAGPWKGVYFYSDSPTPIDVQIFNTTVDRATYTSDSILNLTGGVNIYHSRFTSNGLTILNSPAEDGLNITKSKISVLNLLIRGTSSDAFDCDYCTGTIADSVFERIGGDGLDFSGSTLSVSNVAFFKVRDKAVSIGESSDVKAQLGKALDVYTAVAVKDGSTATIHLNQVYALGPFVMSYRKKSIYEQPSVVYVHTSKNTSVDPSKYVAQTGSQMYVDGAMIKTRQLDVSRLYRSGPMKK